jgi:hypothetical protein
VSLFNWLFPKPAPSGVSESPTLKTGAALAELKKMRHDRRDQLYGVVRDVMLRAEVLASHYKFKVLSLDTQGSQFLVMIDVMAGPLMEPDCLFRIENQINATAAERHSLRVKAVYWRQIAPGFISVAKTAPAKPAAKADSTPPSTAKDIQAPTPVGRGGEKSQGFEPISHDEMMAFKQAIASAATVIAPVVGAAPGASGQRNAEVMRGFEDTQMLDPDEGTSPLSRTQFGDLN